MDAPVEEPGRGEAGSREDASASGEKADGLPVVFRVKGGDRVAGAVFYLFLIPLLALGLSFMAGAFVLILFNGQMGLPKHVSVVSGLVAGLGVFVPILRWAFREYRRRGGGEVRIWKDRLERSAGGKTLGVDYETLEEIEFIHTSQTDRDILVLKGGDEARLDLPSVWPLSAIVQALGDRALPLMASRFLKRLKEGATLEFRTRSFRTLSASISGALALAGGILLLVGFLGRLGKGGEDLVTMLLLALALIVMGVSFLAWAIRNRGRGVIVAREGIRDVRDERSPEVLWDRFVVVQRDSDLLVLGTEDSEVKVRLSRGALNYLVLLEMLRSLLPPAVAKELPTLREETSPFRPSVSP